MQDPGFALAAFGAIWLVAVAIDVRRTFRKRVRTRPPAAVTRRRIRAPVPRRIRAT
jgi:hypothetical protein